jgi:hypothetical protein
MGRASMDVPLILLRVARTLRNRSRPSTTASVIGAPMTIRVVASPLTPALSPQAGRGGVAAADF